MILRAPPREQPIDVAEGAEQVAVVVVARGDERDTRRSATRSSRRCPRARGGVWSRSGSAAADGSDDLDGHARVHVERAADVLERDARGGQLRVEASSIGARDVEPEEACVDPSFTQRRQERQEVPLGTADPGDLVDVQNPHEASSSLR